MNNKVKGNQASALPVKVLFVCLGNICRSPSAHGFFRDVVLKEALHESIYIDSAGTGDWHIGRRPDPRAIEHASKRGVDLDDLRARQVTVDDFEKYDYILAMDNQNLDDLRSMQPANYEGHLGLFLDFAAAYDAREVPDPYYGGSQGFDLVLDMVEDGCQGLLADIRHRFSA